MHDKCILPDFSVVLKCMYCTWLKQMHYFVAPFKKSNVHTQCSSVNEGSVCLGIFQRFLRKIISAVTNKRPTLQSGSLENMPCLDLVFNFKKKMDVGKLSYTDMVQLFIRYC